MYKKSRLANGLRVVTQQMSRMQSVAVGIWINIGGRHETAQNKGISHYLEHLLFKGSRRYSCREIKEAIEGVGGSLNGFTSEELTCYLAKLPARHLERGLGVLSDRVINPSVPSEEVEKERAVILEEIKMYKDLPQSYVNDLLDELLWPAQSLGMSIIGSLDSVSAIKRQQLRDFKDAHYTPLNIVLAAAGAVRHQEFLDSAKAFFSHLSAAKINTFSPAKDRQAGPNLKLLDKQTEQSHLALGFHGLEREHPLKYAQLLLHVILGGNMSSRLFNEVREKRGLAYEIGSSLKRFQDTGAFLIHAGIDNLKVTLAIEVILEELEKTKKALVSRGEFRRAKDFYLGQMKLSLEQTMDNMFWIGENTLMLDKVYTLRQVIAGVERLKREQLRAVARQIFNTPGINLALIGPLSGVQADIRSRLNLG